MKIHFDAGYLFYLDQGEDEGETPTLRGHPVPAPSETRTLNTSDFEAFDASSPEGEAAVQALSE